MFDRSQFIRPIAHRGLHDASAGLLENTAPAFRAGLARGYGLECDLRPAADGTPFVFHDDRLDRLVDASGPFEIRTPGELSSLRYRGQSAHILTYAEFLELASGRVPLLVEIKSEWDAPDPRFLKSIAEQSLAYRGPLALMSFDPAVIIVMKELAPSLPRGIISGHYEGPHWWPDKIDAERAFRLTHCLESGPAELSFIAYDINALPTPVTRFARDVMGLPLFTWTVRTEAQLQRAATWAAAPIFEGCTPAP